MIFFKWIIVLTLIILAPIYSYSQNKNDSVNYYYQKRDFKKGIRYGENIKKNLESTDKINTSEYVLLLNSLGIMCLENNDDKSAESYLQKEVVALINLFGENNRALRNSYFNLANVYYRLGDFKQSEDYYLKAIENVKLNLGINHPDYTKFLIQLAGLYAENKELQKAEISYQEILKNREENLGKQNIDYQKALLSTALFYDNKGDSEKATDFFLQSYSLQKQNLKKETFSDFIFILDLIGKRYINQQNYTQAEKFYFESLEFKKKTIGTDNQDYVRSLLDLGMLFDNQTDYLKSRMYYEEALKILEKNKKNNAKQYSFILEALAQGYWYSGNFNKSLELYLQSEELKKIILGINNEDYLSLLDKIASNYVELSDYEKAEFYYEKALTLKKQFLGENSKDYILTLIEVSNFYLSLNIKIKALENLTKASNLLTIRKLDKFDILNYSLFRAWESYYLSTNNYLKAKEYSLQKIGYIANNPILGVNRPSYARDLSDLALIYEYLGDYQNSEKFYLQAYELRKNSIGQNPRNDVCLLHCLALMYERLNDNKQADYYYTKSFNLFKDKLTEDNPIFDDLLYHAASFYEKSKSTEKTKYCLVKSFGNYQNLINNQILFQSIFEFNFFRNGNIWKRFFPISFLERNANVYPEINIGCYENELLVKNLSLRNQQRISKSIQKSGDTVLRNKYEQFLNNKRQLGKLNELPLDKRPTDYEQLTTETEGLEKELVRSSSAFAEAKNALSINWKQVQEKLQPNELAIDLVAFNYYNKKWTDSIVYSAFVVGKSFKVPKYIPLFEQKQLEFLIMRNSKDHDTIQAGKLNKQYSYKAVSDLFLKPLAKELENVTTIYLAPSGLGNQIDFSALPVSGMQTLGEKYKVHILGSTAEIVNYKVAHFDKKANLELLLYGGIDYNKSEATSIVANDTLGNKSDREFTALATRSGISKWNYLAGTRKEVEQVKINSQQNGFTSTIINGSEATEESIKQLDGRIAPYVLHLATHGFFFPDPKKELPESKPRILEENNNNISRSTHYKISEDPMMRSGLLFAGANKYWGKPTENITTDDGILTASEISNLDLSACLLVVLSACETGLGEINGSEGVFGLQRAFKMAGVKNIIMSLWKVPDAQTAELFDVFYSECFAGKTIHEAFQTAQAKMRAEYSPYYWAGFVLLE